MEKKKECPITNIMNILSKKWVLVILYELNSNGKKRFNELINDSKGISARTLSKRLKELENATFVVKKTFREIPPKVEYSLTKSGKELVKCFGYLNKWANKWDKTN